MIIGGIAAIALTGAIAGGVALKKVNDQIPTTTLSTSAYTIGLLSDTDGKAETGETCGLFTEKYYDLENAEITFKEEANVSVYANLYDKDKAFLKVVKSRRTEKYRNRRKILRWRNMCASRLFPKTIRTEKSVCLKKAVMQNR